MNPNWRALAGMFLILLLILVWSIVVVTGYQLVASTAWPLQALYFLVAGTIWVLPLKPLLRWMQSDRNQA